MPSITLGFQSISFTSASPKDLAFLEGSELSSLAMDPALQHALQPIEPWPTSKASHRMHAVRDEGLLGRARRH